jgi:hypothetical protein
LVSEELAAAAAALVGAVTYDRAALQGIPNPVLQKQFHTLQALALNEGGEGGWVEARDDLLRPPGAWAALAHVEAFAALLPAAGAKPKRKAPAPKAPKNDDDEETPKAKKGRKLAGDDDAEAVDWSALAAAGQLDSQTVPALKAGLKQLGLPVSGNKGALVARIADHFAA